MGNGQFWLHLGQNYASLYLIICSRDFLKCFSIAKHNRSTKVTLVNFPKNFSLWGKQELGINLAQNYGALYIMIGCKDSFWYVLTRQRTKISNKKFTKQVTIFNKTLQIKIDKENVCLCYKYQIMGLCDMTFWKKLHQENSHKKILNLQAANSTTSHQSTYVNIFSHICFVFIV